MSGAAGSAAGGGGDLSGGTDSQRNADLNSLRKMFGAPAADVDTPDSIGTDAQNEKADARKLGLFQDLPLCRFSWCILPNHQITLNIWQPQYTLMFSSLLAEPGPHYYLHVLLPGGAESLGQPGYALQPGTNASLTGTLMRVVYAQRQANSVLTLIVQGLARGVVTRPTQDLPYSRGDVQLLPDGEVLRAAARMVLRRPRDDAPPPQPPSIARRLVAAAATAETEAWLPYEAVSLAMDGENRPLDLNQLNASSAAIARGVDAPSAMEEAMDEAPMPPGVESDGLWAEGSIVHEALTSALDSVEEGESESDDKEEDGLVVLEYQLWVELDDVLSALQVLNNREKAVPLPPQMLALLPEPPEGGWPESFKLSVLRAVVASAAKAKKEEEEEKEEGSKEDGTEDLSYVPMDAAYPVRRRAERLSWLIWAIIGDQKVGVNAYGGSPYQPLIEAEGTAERLRLALLKIREIRKVLG